MTPAHRAAFDHVALGTRTLADGWQLFGSLLGGRWVYGSDSPGYWWGQLQFAAGPKIELLTPTDSPDSAFLERFLAGRGAGPHHLNFIVPDIGATLCAVRSLGIEPVRVNLQNPVWKEAFLHPADAHGTVIQVAEQAARPLSSAAPPGLPAPGPSSELTLVEHVVDDVAGAARLFCEALDGEITSHPAPGTNSPAEIGWHNGARLRLLPAAAGARGIGHLHFSRSGNAFSADELDRAAVLSDRLGVLLTISSRPSPAGGIDDTG